MKSVCFLILFISLGVVCVTLIGCNQEDDGSNAASMEFKLKRGESIVIPIARLGYEDGISIKKQPEEFKISELIFNDSTRFYDYIFEPNPSQFGKFSSEISVMISAGGKDFVSEEIYKIVIDID